ncbi:MAG TPA: hypothetical protein VF215_10295 [Thermoanaerobaculia bacterium]
MTTARRLLWFLTVALFLRVEAFGASALGEIGACGPKLLRVRLDEFVDEPSFRKLKFQLLDAMRATIPTTPTDIAIVDAFGGVTLTLGPNDNLAEGQFVALLDENDRLLDIKPVLLAPEMLQFDRLTPTRIQATFLCVVNPATAKVTVTRNKKDAGITATLDDGSTGRIVKLITSAPLMNEDKVEVTADLTTGGAATVEGKVDFEAPKDLESSTFYVGGKIEAAENSKPKILIDFKYDGHQFPVGNSTRWSHGPSILIDAATQDSDGEGKATIGYGLRRRGYRTTSGADGKPGTPDDRFILTRLDITPSFEADDGLNTRNLIADIQYQALFPGSKWSFKPAIGIEGGTNLAIKTKLEEFSDYNILRPTVDLYLARTFKGIGGLKEISFSIDTQSRYLLEDEPDVEPLPKSEQTDDETTKTIAADGFKFYGKASLTFGLTENYSIALEYEVGEQPPLYGENNKGSLSVVYSF